jgi:predicted ester cyclase
MTARTSRELWTPWAALWNGDLAIADTIIAPDFVARFAPRRDKSRRGARGPDGLKGWIGGAMAAFEGHQFTTVVGPLADGDLVAGRWVFRATYRGGIPGAAPDAAGRRVEYAGMDLFRVEGGQIAEYWLCADILQLLQQIGVLPS